MKKGRKTADKKHLDRIHGLSCCTCGAYPVEAHHIRAGQGMSQRAGDWLTIPLCAACHRGPSGVHGDKSIMRVQKLTESDLLDETLARLYG